MRPNKAGDAANSLSNAISDLSSSLNQAKENDKFISTAKGFGAIASEVVKLALNAKISQALSKAIIASDNNVKVFMQLLREDMAVYERRRNKLSEARKFATREYNTELKSGSSLEKLQKSALEIKKAEDNWNSLPSSLGAESSLDTMAQAHQKLVEYAKSSKTPQDLAELIDATDAFVTEANVIADAIKTIKEAKE